MKITDARPEHWSGIWAVLRRIVAAGDTFTWDTDTDETTARTKWMHEPPGRTFVALDDDGSVVGTAESHANQAGGGSHVANAGFMVHPDHGGRGIGRALCEHTVDQARADGFRAMQFNAVVETNTHAVQLWRSLGFEVMTTLPEAFHHPDHGYVGLHIMYRLL